MQIDEIETKPEKPGYYPLEKVKNQASDASVPGSIDDN